MEADPIDRTRPKADDNHYEDMQMVSGLTVETVYRAGPARKEMDRAILSWWSMEQVRAVPYG